MKKKYFIYLVFLFVLKNTIAQVQLSTYAEISIITAGPGSELYEAFGHSAIRVKDPMLQLDLIYNYGMFDFNAPNFYSNFTKGKLIYKLGRYKFEYFLRSYHQDKRWVKEQTLRLTPEEKQSFFMYLERNASPKNASYFYDPYYNNCATKLRDIVEHILGNKLLWNTNNLTKNKSLRVLMNKEIPWNTWGSFGINLALGNVLDKEITFREYMYLPDYVHKTFKDSQRFIKSSTENLVEKETTILDFKEAKIRPIFLSPFLVFSCFCIIVLIFTFLDYKHKKRAAILDFTVLFSSGAVGVLLLFLWFFTDHSTTPNNFNILWAFAPNTIISFLMIKKDNVVLLHIYFKVLMILLLLIPVFWIVGIQQFPLAAIPLLVALFFRYVYLSHFYKV
jgi:hypothetical protein